MEEVSSEYQTCQALKLVVTQIRLPPMDLLVVIDEWLWVCTTIPGFWGLRFRFQPHASLPNHDEDGVDGVRHEFAQLGVSNYAIPVAASSSSESDKPDAIMYFLDSELGWWINAPAHLSETSSVVHCNSFGDQSWCKVRKDPKKISLAGSLPWLSTWISEIGLLLDLRKWCENFWAPYCC